jgi:Ni,Fe-hydrogenase III small subunit
MDFRDSGGFYMKTNNWFLKGLTKLGRTEKFPSEKFEAKSQVNEKVKSEKFMPFNKSLHLYSIDSGACGACNMELQAISTPHYDMNRLGLFFTNTPRHADALIILGVHSERMVEVLEKAYNAMPKPKLIISLGDCALSGGLIGECPEISGKSVVNIPGCPPNPYAILEGIIKAKEVSSK